MTMRLRVGVTEPPEHTHSSANERLQAAVNASHRCVVQPSGSSRGIWVFSQPPSKRLLVFPVHYVNILLFCFCFGVTDSGSTTLLCSPSAGADGWNLLNMLRFLKPCWFWSMLGTAETNHKHPGDLKKKKKNHVQFINKKTHNIDHDRHKC